MTNADLIWNRATLNKGGTSPRSGDRALTALLCAHGLAMNGGVLHAVEILNDQELADARSGYQFYGFEQIANLLFRAKDLFEAGVDLNSFERLMDFEYASQIPNDSVLVERFERHFSENPSNFAPL